MERRGSSGVAAERQRRRSALRAAGLRGTAARVAVLEVMEGLEAPISHSELSEHAKLQGFDRATIYRNLIDLTDAGLVARADLGDHVWRFELKSSEAERSEDHPHFMCVDCGTVSCLEDVEVRILPKRRRDLRQISEILVKGRCESCV